MYNSDVCAVCNGSLTSHSFSDQTGGWDEPSLLQVSRQYQTVWGKYDSYKVCDNCLTYLSEDELRGEINDGSIVL
jgi:hypothetical protein